MIQDRWLAGGFSLTLLSAVLWPIVENWRAAKHDDFPLSYYPMFSHRREKRLKVIYLLGITTTGERVNVSYKLIGPGGFNQVRRQLRQIVKAGRAEALCRQIAPRVHRAHPDLDVFRVVTGTYELNRFFGGDRRPIKEIVHAEARLREATQTREEG